MELKESNNLRRTQLRSLDHATNDSAMHVNSTRNLKDHGLNRAKLDSCTKELHSVETQVQGKRVRKNHPTIICNRTSLQKLLVSDADFVNSECADDCSPWQYVTNDIEKNISIAQGSHYCRSNFDRIKCNNPLCDESSHLNSRNFPDFSKSKTPRERLNESIKGFGTLQRRTSSLCHLVGVDENVNDVRTRDRTSSKKVSRQSSSVRDIILWTVIYFGYLLNACRFQRQYNLARKRISVSGNSAFLLLFTFLLIRADCKR